MMENVFYHALRINKDKCVGCSRCMSVCPTEAIRVKNGKACLIENRCIDCGECYKVCQSKAIEIKQDDLDKIFSFKYRVVLFPSILLGQFSSEIKIREIYSVLYNIGFTHVFEVEHTADLLFEKTKELIENSNSQKPIISSFCPAVVRLIQAKFPSLLDNISNYKAPHDLAAILYRHKLEKEGINPKDIGVFYITPCAAKIASVKSPVGEIASEIDGVINLDFIYNKISQNLQKSDDKSNKTELNNQLSENGIMWSLTGGEKANIPGRCLAVDGIENVIQFLNKLESGEIENLDFLELRACDESCAGGILLPSNRFLTVERMKKISKKFDKLEGDYKKTYGEKDIEKYKSHILNNIKVDKIPPRNMDALSDDMTVSLDMMQKINEIKNILPQIDCGVCGAPSCDALAEDIVRFGDTPKKCIFIQRYLSLNKIMNEKECSDILASIWTEEKLDSMKKILKII